jgi:hypothetical protein
MQDVISAETDLILLGEEHRRRVHEHGLHDKDNSRMRGKASDAAIGQNLRRLHALVGA